MQKFLRKHMNKILTVSMALLLVVWLGGSALTEMLAPNPGEFLVGTSMDGDIHQSDLFRMQNLTAILTRLGIPWEAISPDPQDDPLSVYHWILLTREARRLGFSPSPEDAKTNLAQVGLNEGRVNNLANSLDIAPKTVYAAVAEYQNVMNVVEVIAQSARVGEAETRVAARDAIEKINVNLVSLPASKFVDPESTFSDAEIQAFYEKYREEEAGSASSMSFGYFQKPKVRVEFAKVDAKKIEENLNISEKTLERQARRFWKQNKTHQAFRKPTPPPVKIDASEVSSDDTPPKKVGEIIEDQSDDSTTEDGSDSDAGQGSFRVAQAQAESNPESGADNDQPAAETQNPAGKPATDTATITGQPATPVAAPKTPAPSPFYEDWVDARDAAIAQVRTEEANKRAAKLAAFLIQRASEPWYDMETGEDFYRRRPAGVEGKDYLANLTTNLPPEFPYADAVTTGETDLFNQLEASGVPDLGISSIAVPGGSTIPFRNIVFNVQGLVTLTEDSKMDRSLLTALYQPGSLPLKDATGNLYLYRVVEVKEAQPPERLEDVKDQVVADMKKQRGFDQAKEWAEKLKAKAATKGLDEAAKDSAELAATLGEEIKVQTPSAFERQLQVQGISNKAYVAGFGLVDTNFTKACFELGPADKGRESVAVIEVPELSTVAVVEFRSMKRIDRDAYIAQRRALRQRLFGERRNKVVLNWLTPAQVISRNRYEPVTDEG